jgi:hypothetical protein
MIRLHTRLSIAEVFELNMLVLIARYTNVIEKGFS